ncbi:hypothetical protein KEM55_001593 [Ascosphaera atra]|nr:hypothetical protein KEM55_001593 [Ascosphaera atra]
MAGLINYPLPSKDRLQKDYVGRLLSDIEGPVAVIDVAIAKRNCDLMLKATEALGVDFRAHVKSHKTTELTRHQVDSDEFKELVSGLKQMEESTDSVRMRGFYTHQGSSYGSDSNSEALGYLAQELSGCEAAAVAASKIYGPDKSYTFSVGATPTATSVQDLLSADAKNPSALYVKELLERCKAMHNVELHAGAYVTLDMQQLAAHARSSNLSYKDIALSVLTEVASVYTRAGGTEALVPCGKLSLGYDTCKSYEGMGVVMSWRDRNLNSSSVCDIAVLAPSRGIFDPDGSKIGWVVDRTSQEHGLLRYRGEESKDSRRLQVGEKIRIIPNHCCMCLANFDFVLVVDSEADGEPIEKERVRDVWLSWRGW